MAVLQMLPEVIGAEEFLRLVTLPELVYVVQVLGPNVPLWRVGELLSAITAGIDVAFAGRCVIGGLNTRQDGAGPGVFAEMKGILVAFCFVLVFEPVGAVGAGVLLLSFV